jgi:hypothetical protein
VPAGWWSRSRGMPASSFLASASSSPT